VTFDDLVNRAIARFDEDPAIVAAITNERQASMMADAAYRLAELHIGPTAANVSDYTLGATVENIAFIQLGADTVPLIRANQRQMADLRNGRASISDDDVPGAFAIHADSSGVLSVRIFPTPAVAGVDIIASGVVDPSDTAYGTNLPLLVPRRVHRHLLDGVIAELYEQLESRWDLAAPHEQSYERGIDKLRHFKNARLGQGPTQVVRGW
jgi:hypothetical protein